MNRLLNLFLVVLLALSASYAHARVAETHYGAKNLENIGSIAEVPSKALMRLGKFFDSTIAASGRSLGPEANTPPVDESLYNRGSWRTGTRTDAEANAPRNENGDMICPTCGDDIPDVIVRETRNGPQERVGYDLDHYPDTWADRVDEMQTRDVPPARTEVLDEYNRDVRVQCPGCNQGHQFEGVEGDFSHGSTNGQPNPPPSSNSSSATD